MCQTSVTYHERARHEAAQELLAPRHREGPCEHLPANAGLRRQVPRLGRRAGPEHAAAAPMDPVGEEEDEAVDTENADTFDGPQA